MFKLIVVFSLLALAVNVYGENHEATINVVGRHSMMTVHDMPRSRMPVHHVRRETPRRRKSDGNVCSFSDMDYKLQFFLDSKTGRVHFDLTYNNFPQQYDVWTGVAFGNSMFGLDAVIVRVLGGRIIVTDEFTRGYGPSIPDSVQDVKMIGGSIQNGVLRVQFTKPVETNQRGQDAALNGCTPWQFVTGLSLASPSHVSKHTRFPIRQEVCLDKCTQ
ncbi:unnamed protein product [Bursaphelenchus xylophilus]|uniref:(pine wood nematode) hypothetical protein n=1 Tax=Bursaphelenchus xylophilus TaxID=6326 RepID=A0A1I7SR19_BURXY|nr:unnamed protein product [Bursaphelenchus xylophilus]CAG9110706.1 unnamed protein product [Bursaphelenchus xylophilus]